ncbi:Pentatricopeptide repeat-containing protein MRL1 chloroplastic [Dissostichus eleginoides]|uniref:Pentatricopeptide repeat-containing protein MRL1 chloroplastic n=1 Tax=Dissostichus eleginoides TaxID=100907 RepID=A0AAD9CEJ1_DISEL|nr:Pentatricopeptide repeat-containing protein MRL1 chloroplastic [Dissostichus eleginoides]
MAFQKSLSVVAAPPSIRLDTQGLHYTLMGWDGKPIEGIWVRGGKQRIGVGNHTDRQSAMMKRLPSLSLLSDPACPPASPSSPTALYCNALAADQPDTCHTSSHSPQASL